MGTFNQSSSDHELRIEYALHIGLDMFHNLGFDTTTVKLKRVFRGEERDYGWISGSIGDTLNILVRFDANSFNRKSKIIFNVYDQSPSPVASDEEREMVYVVKAKISQIGIDIEAALKIPCSLGCQQKLLASEVTTISDEAGHDYI